jgi:acyl dehydratase
MTDEEIAEAVATIQRAGGAKPLTARDPVNLPMIRNWLEAMGDANRAYVDEEAARAAGHDGIVAPPAMIQAWTMRGLHDRHAADDPLGQALDLLTRAGFPAVVATNCDQVYHRYLRLGEPLTMVTRLERVVGPKQTSLGRGWFISTRHTWHCAGEEVATMEFRLFKYLSPGAVAGQTGEAGRAGPRAAAASQPDHAGPEDPRPEHAAAGERLPALRIGATPTFIIAAALATRDFQDVHHDRDAAVALGGKDIFVNILTDTGLVQRYVTDWAGPSARVREISLRLLVPCYAYDTLVFSGAVTNAGDADLTVSVSARGQLGEHLAGTVRLTR